MHIKNVETLKFKCIGVVGAIDVHGKTVALKTPKPLSEY